MVSECFTSKQKINSGPILLFCGNSFNIEGHVKCAVRDFNLHRNQALIDKTMHICVNQTDVMV